LQIKYKKIQFGGLAQIPTGRINNIVFIGNTDASATILNALFINCILSFVACIK
jgi:hypothetical protein